MIDTPLDEFQLCETLENLVTSSKSIDLSRRAIATLGEYIFFVATQAEGEEENGIWFVSESSLNALLYALESKDETMKFYSLKSIENIAALTSVAEIYFAKESFLMLIMDVFLLNKNVDLRISAIFTVSHLIRLNSSLFEKFNKKLSLEMSSTLSSDLL